MKKSLSFLLLASVFIIYGCCNKEKKEAKNEVPLIEKKEMKLTTDLMTPEVLWAFGRVSEPVVSPRHGVWHAVCKRS